MFRSMFSNIPDVTKNLLILNVLFFLATMVGMNQDINLIKMLGMYYPGSPEFQPFQIITHFFMHGGFMHIFFNMFAVIVFGSHLERVWGKKRYFMFYVITALGAALLHFGVVGYQVYELTGSFFPDYAELAGKAYSDGYMIYGPNDLSVALYKLYHTPVVGASGALYGLILGFAMLFPNTQLMLLFPPIPVKAKWLAIFLGAVALYNGYTESGGNIAHFAHLGGMLFGFIMIQIWKRDKTKFY